MTKKIILPSLFLLTILSCSHKFKDLVKIKQVDSNYPIYVQYFKYGNSVNVYFPLVFSMSKKTIQKIKLSFPGSNYYYKNTISFLEKKGEWDYGLWGGSFAKNENNILKVMEEIEDRMIPYFGEKECITYTMHGFIMSDTAFQSFVELYKDKIPKKEKDTVHIGSIQEWKKTNPELLNTFLKGDSIELIFEYDEGFHYIRLPVEIR